MAEKEISVTVDLNKDYLGIVLPEKAKLLIYNEISNILKEDGVKLSCSQLETLCNGLFGLEYEINKIKDLGKEIDENSIKLDVIWQKK